MNGTFQFGEDGKVRGLNIKFENDTEINAWNGFCKACGGGVIPETKMVILTGWFGVGISIEKKKKD